MTEQPSLSIIISSYTTDRLKDIFELLDSLKAQTYPRIETNFVVERSVELLDKVKAYAIENNLPNFKTLFNDGEAGLSAARNLGIKQAQGNIIAFVDDDVVLFPDWAEAMVTSYKDDTVIGVTGPALPLWEDKSMNWFPEEFYWIISCTAWSGWNEIREVRSAWGMNMSFKKEAFDKCGLFQNEFGFHKGTMAEDNEFSSRVRKQTGKRIVYCPSVRVHHRVHKYRLTTKFIKERAYWIGYSRRNIQNQFAAEKGRGMNALDQEHQLVRRIFTRLLPSLLAGFLTHPVKSWRRFKVTTTALIFVGLGYFSHTFPCTNDKGGK